MLIKILTENLDDDDLYILKLKGVDVNKFHNVDIIYDNLLNEESICLIDKDNKPIILINNAEQKIFEPVVKEMTIREIEGLLGYYIKIIG